MWAAAESLPADVLGALDQDDVRIAKSASRSVLGVMNDMAMHVECAVVDAAGLRQLDVAAINHALRRGLPSGTAATSPRSIWSRRAATDDCTPDSPLPPPRNCCGSARSKGLIGRARALERLHRWGTRKCGGFATYRCP